MEVVNDNCALLGNAEVLLLLKEIQNKKRKLKSNKNLATIAYESIKYLQDSPANQQNHDNISKFLLSIKDKFRLTKAEKLQITNHKPTSMVELQLLIQENEERFSEEAMQELLDMIKNTLNGDDNSQNDQNNQDSDEIQSD